MAYSYESPAWKNTGEITLNPSQEGKLGIVVPDDFEDWFYNSGAQYNLKEGVTITKNGDGSWYFEGTDELGFVLNNKLTWYLVLE